MGAGAIEVSCFAGCWITTVVGSGSGAGLGGELGGGVGSWLTVTTGTDALLRLEDGLGVGVEIAETEGAGVGVAVAESVGTGSVGTGSVGTGFVVVGVGSGRAIGIATETGAEFRTSDGP